jgi:hypothetical protein
MKTLNCILLLTSALFLLKCNPMYEDVQGKMRNSLHPSRPPFSTIYHGASFRFPYGACDEVQCHGADLRGGNSGAPSCYSCHGNKWTIFTTTHTLKVAGIYHHTAVDTGSTTDNTSWFSTCKDAACHGVNLEGVAGAGYRCQDCHNPIPAPGHRSKKEGAWHHFNYSHENPSVYCSGSVCHGASGEGTGTTLAPPCSTCHD